ncbi:MAG: Rossmann-like and DUF2520 domain-containing protein [Desulfobacterales bacterium]
MKPSFVIVGCGKVGTILARQMQSSGYPLIGLASRSLSSAKKVADETETKRFSDIPWEVTTSADIVFITTPDGSIQESSRKIAENKGFKQNAVVLHCSGALPSTILASAKTCGASIGSMHPLQSFATSNVDTNPFKGIIAAIEGEEDAVHVARQIAADLEAISLTIKTDAKTLYHAAAVVASNYLVALQDLAFQLLQISGIPTKRAFQVLGPLINGTLSNIEKVGTVKALTGPIVRGDAETVKKHVDEISSMAPELLTLYRTLGRHTVTIAESGGNLSKEQVQRLFEILDENA